MTIAFIQTAITAVQELSNPAHYALISVNLGSILVGGFTAGKFIQRLKSLEQGMQEMKDGQIRIETDIKNILLKG